MHFTNCKDNSSSDKNKVPLRRNPRKLLLLALAFAVLAVITNMAIDMFGFKQGSDINIEIQKDISISELSQTLYDYKIINYKYLFEMFYSTISTTVKSGKVTVSKSMSYLQLTRQLAGDNSGWISKIFDKFRNTIKVTIPEGYTIKQIANKLKDNKIIDDTQTFINETQNGKFDYYFLKDIPSDRPNKLEGYLFPATYLIKPGTSEHEIIKRMLDKFESELNNLKNDLEISKRDLDDVITMASIIEKESANHEERPQIASVYYNRLKRNDFLKYLQSCATVQYILPEYKAVLAIEDTKTDSKYNTYKYPGLPIGPICNPSKNAIMAAIHPANTSYLYFVLNPKTGLHIFSQTYEEHLNAKSQSKS